jgi:hypothetical protein
MGRAAQASRGNFWSDSIGMQARRIAQRRLR